MRASRIAGAFVEGGIYCLILLTPFFHGGVHGWARGTIQIIAGGIVLARLIERRGEARPGPEARRAAVAIGAPAGLFVALVLFQLVPLPPSIMAVVAPGSYRLYEATVPGYVEGAEVEARQLPGWLLDRPRARALLVEERIAASVPGADLETSPFDAGFSASRSASIVPHETGQRLSLLLACLAIVVVTAGHFRTCERLRRLAAVMVISGLATAAFSLLDRAGWVGTDGASLLGPFVNRNTYAAFLGAVIPVAIGMALASLGERRIDRGLLWGLASVLLTGAVFFSLSRGGILSWAVSLSVLALLVVYFERRAVAVATLAALLAASALFLAWLGPGDVLGRIATVSEGSSEPSLAQRIGVWKRALAVAGDYPGIGAGLGTFRYAFMGHAPPEEAWWRDAHNEYLELLCDTGLAGGLLAGGALAAFLIVAVRPSRMVGRGERFLMIGMAPGLMSVAIHSSVTTNLQVPAVGLLASALAGALIAMATAPRPDTASSVPRSGSGRLHGLAVVVLVAALGLNTIGGAAAIAGFIHRDSGEESLARAEMDRALESLMAAARWQPGDARTYELIARVAELSLTGRLPLAMTGGDRPDAILGLGLGAIAAGLDANPGNSRTWFALATLYQGHRSHRELTRAIAAASSGGEAETGSPAPEDSVSIGAILQAQQLQPEFTAYHDYLAGILRRDGLLDAASDQLRRSFRLRPHLADHALIDLDKKGFLEDHGEAILEGIETAEPDPFTSPMMKARSRAKLLEKMGRLDEAIRAYGELRNIGGEAYEAEFHLAFGRIDQKRGNYADSIAKLEVAARAGRGTTAGAWAIYHLGIATSRSGQHSAAIRYYRTFLALMPDHVSAWTGLAGELDLVGQIEEAERLYREAVALFPDEPAAYQGIISFLERQGRKEEAGPYRERLRRLGP